MILEQSFWGICGISSTLNLTFGVACGTRTKDGRGFAGLELNETLWYVNVAISADHNFFELSGIMEISCVFLGSVFPEKITVLQLSLAGLLWTFCNNENFHQPTIF